MKPHALLIVAAGLLVAAAQKKATDSLDGQYAPIEAKEKGIDTPKDFLEKTTFTIKGNKITFTDGEMTHEGTFKLDPSKNPKTIDLVPGDGPMKGKTMLGIYKVDGKTLTLCFATTMPDEKPTRPKEFVSDKEKNKNFLVVLKKK